MKLKDKVAIVTGGARGIGAAICRRYADEGARVVVADLLEAEASALAQEIGRGAFPVGLDVTSQASIDAAMAEVVQRAGGIDILVNNAGMAIRKPALTVPMAEWQQVIDVNLTALFMCSRIAVRYMKMTRMARPQSAPGGCIVNLASIMGLSGGIFPNASYQASKGGVVNLTRALALEWAGDGIRVNAVAPTFVNTDFTAQIFNNPAVLEQVEKHTPLGVLPEVDDIAAAILFLAGPAARCITGVTLPVDSGYLAR
jgi:NAD(P)-dependent dehydrogenase (short-subunit alcohol dehydrogenase family)